MSLRRIEANTYEVEVLKPLCRLDVMSSILRPEALTYLSAEQFSDKFLAVR
jgi:hypothetical protein